MEWSERGWTVPDGLSHVHTHGLPHALTHTTRRGGEREKKNQQKVNVKEGELPGECEHVKECVPVTLIYLLKKYY